MNARERIRKAGTRRTKGLCVPLAMVVLMTTFLVFAFVPAATASPDWTTPDEVSPADGYGEYPNIEVDLSGKAHLVWEDWETTDDYKIFYASGTPGDWSAPERIDTLDEYDQKAPNLAVDAAGNVYVVWEMYDEDLSAWQVYYAINAGGTWSDPVRLSTQSDYDQCEQETDFWTCQIELDSAGAVHVVWYGYDETGYDYRIWYSTNAGGTWSDPLCLSTQSVYYQEYPAMKLDPSGNVHVVWEGYDVGEVYWHIWYADNTGGTWSDPVVIDGDDMSYPYYSNLAVDSTGAVHAIWHSELNSNCDIGYATNAGGTWSSPVIISGDYYHSGNHIPSIAVDPADNPHVVWEGYEVALDKYRIFYTTPTSGVWADPLLLSTGLVNGDWDPQIAISPDGAPNVVWNGYDESNTYYQAYYATNSALYTPEVAGDWCAPVNLSYRDGYDSYDPMIAVDIDGNPHVAWDDYDDTYDQIIYRADIRQRIVNATVNGSGGTVNPATQAVAIGGTATVTLAPDTGFMVKSVTDNGVPVSPTPQNSYTITNVNEHHEVVVSFAKGTWYLAEGCTLDGFETWILVENPGDAPAKISMAFDTDQGEVVLPEMQNLTVPAHSRSSWNLANYIQTYDVATRVSSDNEVICERAMYGNERAWATCSVGTQMPSDTWYLPEGCTGDGFESWILVQNPNDYTVSINFALDTEIGLVQNARMQDLNMPAHTRASWNLADYHTSYDVATVLTSDGGPVVAERSMYAPDRAWAHNSIGTIDPDFEWYLAEGCTVDSETWVLVQNPGSALGRGGHHLPDRERRGGRPAGRGRPGLLTPLLQRRRYRAELQRLHHRDLRIRSGGGGALHVQPRAHLGHLLHRHHHPRRHLVPG